MTPKGPEPRLDAETIRKYETDYVLYPWVAQKGLNPVIVDRAKGNYFWDPSGKQYLDFTSMFVFSNLGHADPRVVNAIAKQAERLPAAASPFATEAKAELAKLLAEVTPGDVKKTFFSTSGAEANEGAIKIARAATGREKIIARYRSYHGSTFGAMTLTNDFRNWAFEPAIPSVIHCLDPYCYRCPFGLTHPACDLQCAKHVEDVIRFEGEKRVAGFMAETIVGANGIIVPPDGYWQKIREICDRYGVVMMVDEVMVGFGRTGKWFAIEHWGVVPDVITMAKGITSGYVPLGATSVREGVARAFETNPYVHGHTYSGHTLAMAAGAATLKAYIADGLIDRSAEMGEYLMKKAIELKDKHLSVGDVRGKGLFVGLELVKNRRTKEPIHDPLFEGPRSPTAKMKVLGQAMKEGVYCLPGVASVIMLAPPLTITKGEIDFAMGVFDRALALADEETTR
ncbi:MAG: aminotransferase class III-fold pyridoxal phosphate-dependent enzyme [Deltaproteobacteria bacterium]|jgi:taurine--2-oxoglutarate transaminase|nr:aminotransferase class III-fold pyridoxal phosphate-dependent enzyme [Deltaproteobacteria bacterium]